MNDNLAFVESHALSKRRVLRSILSSLSGARRGLGRPGVEHESVLAIAEAVSQVPKVKIRALQRQVRTEHKASAIQLVVR
jgi:hypothetical protein